MRSALGASRWQIARGLLVESLLLSATGASLGLFVAWAGIEVLRSAIPASVPRVSQIGIDWRVLALSGAAAIATGILFGLVPALHCSRPNLIHVLRERSRAAAGGVSKQRMRSALSWAKSPWPRRCMSVRASSLRASPG
jgi:putative ABC transport system permease protein